MTKDSGASPITNGICNGASIGIVVLGHGSKLEKANDTIRKVITHIKKGNGYAVVEPAFLQLSMPDLRTSIKKVVDKGCKKVVIVPFFLFMGNHVTRDIPSAIEREADAHKDVEFIYAQNLGSDPRINDIVLDRINEAL